jgi:hypothetical protein
MYTLGFSPCYYFKYVHKPLKTALKGWHLRALSLTGPKNTAFLTNTAWDATQRGAVLVYSIWISLTVLIPALNIGTLMRPGGSQFTVYILVACFAVVSHDGVLTRRLHDRLPDATKCPRHVRFERRNHKLLYMECWRLKYRSQHLGLGTALIGAGDICSLRQAELSPHNSLSFAAPSGLL